MIAHALDAGVQAGWATGGEVTAKAPSCAANWNNVAWVTCWRSRPATASPSASGPAAVLPKRVWQSLSAGTGPCAVLHGETIGGATAVAPRCVKAVQLDAGTPGDDFKASFEIGAGLVRIAVRHCDHGDSCGDDDVREFSLDICSGAVDAFTRVLSRDSYVRLNGFTVFFGDFQYEGLFVDFREKSFMETGELVPHGVTFREMRVWND